MILQNGLFNLTLKQIKMEANKIYREVLIGSVVLATLIYLFLYGTRFPLKFQFILTDKEIPMDMEPRVIWH